MSPSLSPSQYLSLSVFVFVITAFDGRKPPLVYLNERILGFGLSPHTQHTYTWQPWHVLCGFALLAIKCHLNPAKSAKRIPVLTRRRCQRKTINIAVCNNNLLFLVRRCCPPRATSSPHACNHWRGQGGG